MCSEVPCRYFNRSICACSWLAKMAGVCHKVAFMSAEHLKISCRVYCFLICQVSHRYYASKKAVFSFFFRFQPKSPTNMIEKSCFPKMLFIMTPSRTSLLQSTMAAALWMDHCQKACKTVPHWSGYLRLSLRYSQRICFSAAPSLTPALSSVSIAPLYKQFCFTESLFWSARRLI